MSSTANHRARVRRLQDDPAIRAEVNSIRREQLGLFLKQQLVVAGDLYFKSSRFHKSRRYHAELRGSTIAVFRNSSIARSPDVNIADVVAVVVVPQYNIDVIQKDENTTRIYITADFEGDETLMYIKVTSSKPELEAWCSGLAKAKSRPIPNLNDLVVESVIGRGGGGKVFLVKWKQNMKTYALKVIDKVSAYRSAKSYRHVVTERYLMEKLGSHPFLLPIQFAFQTERNLFIGTPFCAGGDLATYLRNNGETNAPAKSEAAEKKRMDDQKKKKIYGRLSEAQTRLIAAEVILGLEHLHKQGIVYRDLKPENIFIDGSGHVKLGDYGLAKQLHGDVTELRSGSVCGTRNYLPPEMLFGKMYSLQADMWSLGVMLYRMLCGVFPFDAPRSRELFAMVKSLDLVVPQWLSSSSGLLLLCLLEKDPAKRPTVHSIKNEPFFHRLNWDEVYSRSGGESIPDVEVGESALDALDNFELSKLQGVTVGDYIGQYGDLEYEVIVAPSHLQDARKMMVGFEFGLAREDGREPAPLEVRHSGGSFWKMASMDADLFIRSPRGVMNREQINMRQEGERSSVRRAPS